MQEKDKKKPAGEKSKDKRRKPIEEKMTTKVGAGTDPVPTPDGHK